MITKLHRLAMDCDWQQYYKKSLASPERKDQGMTTAQLILYMYNSQSQRLKRGYTSEPMFFPDFMFDSRYIQELHHLIIFLSSSVIPNEV